MNTKEIKRATIGRLPQYLRYISSLPQEITTVSATGIAKALDLGEVQVRKDLGAVCGAGRPRVGYDRAELTTCLEDCLGGRPVAAVIVGAGKLGRALLDYAGFSEYGTNILAAFDLNVPAEGDRSELKPVLPMSALAATWDISNGDITVNAGSGGQTVTQGAGAAVEDNAPVIKGSSTENTVTINAEKDQTANVTIEDVNIDVSSAGKAAVTTTGEGNVNIELNGSNALKSGHSHAGLEKNSDGNLTIQDKDKDGSLNAKGGQDGAGIGGGSSGAGSDITITDGEVNATGGKYGAGIGGGLRSKGKDITVSGDTKLKVQGGDEDHYDGAGAGIGDGGSNAYETKILGAEVEPDTSGLTTNGSIAYYAPGADMENDKPTSITFGTSSQPEKPIEPAVPEQPEAERGMDAPLYRVTDKDGRDIVYTAERKDGVLTVNVDEDFAILTGRLSGIRTLKVQGVEKIIFVTKGAASAFLLSDLLEKGESGDTYLSLIHI